MKLLVPSLAAICIVVIVSGTAWGVTGTLLPYGTGFETGSFDDPWAATNGGTPVFEDTLTPPDESDQYLYVPSSADLCIADGGLYSNVWWYSYAKVTGQTEDASPAIGNSVAGVLVEEDGGIRAYSSNAWVDVGSVSIPASGWIGLSVHLDYVNRKYDVYRTPTSYTYGDAFEKANSVVLHFNTNASAQTKFEKFTVEGDTRLDEVALSAGHVTNDAIADENTPSNSVNASVNMYLQEGPSGALVKYFAPADRRMDGPLGDALFGSLLPKDKVFIRESDGTIHEFERPTTGSDWTVNQGSAAITVDPGTGIYIKFHPDNDGAERPPASIAAYNTTYPAEDMNIPASQFSLLAVPMDAVSNLSIVNGAPALGLPSPLVGDRMYIKRVGATGYIYLRCKVAGAWVDISNSPANVTLQPGQAFYYYRAGVPGDDDGNWDVDGASGVY
jgi:hypothetical protein